MMNKKTLILVAIIVSTMIALNFAAKTVPAIRSLVYPV